jgi:hypothetical protein
MAHGACWPPVRTGVLHDRRDVLGGARRGAAIAHEVVMIHPQSSTGTPPLHRGWRAHRPDHPPCFKQQAELANQRATHELEADPRGTAGAHPCVLHKWREAPSRREKFGNLAPNRAASLHLAPSRAASSKFGTQTTNCFKKWDLLHILLFPLHLSLFSHVK